MKAAVKVVVIIVCLVVALVAGAALLISRLDFDAMKRDGIAKASTALGREITVNGDFSFIFWPDIGVTVNDVTVAGMAGGTEPHIAKIGTLDVALAVQPLLQREIVVRHVTLKNTDIALEKNARGEGNWNFKPAPAAANVAAEQKAEGNTPDASDAAATPDGSARDRFRVTLGDLRIDNASLRYKDAAAGTAYALEKVNARIDLVNLDSPLSVKADMVYNGEKIDLTLDAENAQLLADGKPVKTALNVSSAPLTLQFDGTLETAAPAASGTLKIGISDIARMRTWATGEKADAVQFNSLRLDGVADYRGDTVALKDATVQLDNQTVSGNLSVALAGKPRISGILSVGRLDLDALLGTGAENASKTSAASKGGDQGWDDTPIDLSVLSSVDADLSVKTDGIKIKGTDIGATMLKILLKNGDLNASHTPATIFGGTMESSVRAATSGAVGLNAKLTNADARPLLANFAGFDKVSGKLNADIAVTGQGKSQRAIVSSLGGNGKFSFSDGAVHGIDIVNLAKRIQGGLANAGIGEGKTDFVDLGGTFTIAKGIVSNNDLAMRGPLVQVAGQGTVNLPQKTLNYRVSPTLTASSGVDNAGGLTVPLLLSGPFSNIKVSLDPQGVVDMLRDPEALKQNLKNIKENAKKIEDQFDPLKDQIKGLKGDKTQRNDAIKGLLGGFGIAVPETAKETAPATAPKSAPAPAKTTTSAKPAVPAEPAPAPAEPVAAPPATIPEPASAPAAQPAPAAPANDDAATPAATQPETTPAPTEETAPAQ